MMKKTILIIGAILVSIMMISNVSAVQQVNSKPVVNLIEKEENNVNIKGCSEINKLKKILNTNLDVEIPDNQLISNLEYKLDQFSEKYGVGKNIDDFDWKNKDQKDLFISIKDDIEDNINNLYDELSILESSYGINIHVEDPNNENTERYQNWDKSFVESASSTVWDFFEGYIESEDFDELEQSFTDTGIYDELEEYIDIALNEDINSDEKFLTQYTGILDAVMIFICYVVFMANYIIFGPVGSQFTDDIVALLLGILLFVPASISVIFHYLGKNVMNVGVAFISALEIFIGVYAGSLLASLQYGLIGFLVWAIFAVGSIVVGWPILAVAFILVWISEFIKISDGWNPGDIINTIPQYIHDIILAAWQMVPSYCGDYDQLGNYLSRWLDIWPLPDPDITAKGRTNNFFKSENINERIFERIELIIKHFNLFFSKKVI